MAADGSLSGLNIRSNTAYRDEGDSRESVMLLSHEYDAAGEGIVSRVRLPSKRGRDEHLRSREKNGQSVNVGNHGLWIITLRLNAGLNSVCSASGQ